LTGDSRNCLTPLKAHTIETELRGADPSATGQGLGSGDCNSGCGQSPGIAKWFTRDGGKDVSSMVATAGSRDG